MANLTIAVDDELLKQARIRAVHGRNFHQRPVRDTFTDYVGLAKKKKGCCERFAAPFHAIHRAMGLPPMDARRFILAVNETLFPDNNILVYVSDRDDHYRSH